MRIHPADSRVRMLAEASPASFVAFDCLADGDDDLRGRPFVERRARLERFAADPPASVQLTPSTTDPDVARHWFDVFEGAGLDGVIASAPTAYEPGKRTMAKIKRVRTADCVVAGFRWHKNGPGTLIGSLLLGLLNADGQLQHVGVTSSFTMAKRAELVEFLEPYRPGGMEDHPWREWALAEAAAVEEGRRMPGATSRWNRGKDLSWEPLRPELVCEVAFDHLQGDRFRHAATFRRWRTDRSPEDCRYDQLEETPPALLADLFGADAGSLHCRPSPPKALSGVCPSVSVVPDPNAAVNDLADRFWEGLLERDPMWATVLGDDRYDHRWPDLGVDGRAAEEAAFRGALDEARAIPVDGFDVEQVITRDLLILVCENQLAALEQKQYQLALITWPARRCGPRRWRSTSRPTRPSGLEALLAR